MRRLSPLGLLGLLALFLAAGCGSVAEPPLPAPRPAEPRQATVSWLERYPSEGPALAFGVRRIEVTREGWSAEISIRNGTKNAFGLGDQPAELAFGVMLFADDDLEALQTATALPSIRRARTIEPPPPARLAPGATWRATISAPGSLGAGSYLRVTFGALRAVGDGAPSDLTRPVVWITDHAFEL